MNMKNNLKVYLKYKVIKIKVKLAKINKNINFQIKYI